MFLQVSKRAVQKVLCLIRCRDHNTNKKEFGNYGNEIYSTA